MIEKKNTSGEVISVKEAMKGSISDDIILAEAAKQSPEELQNELYKVLKRYEHDGEILWGTIYGIEQFDGHVIFCVLWKGYKVSIPENVYFEPSYNFGKNYPTLSDKEKLKFRMKEANFKIGAIIPFKVIAANKETIAEGAYANEELITIIGDRTAAMATIRDMWFWHKNRKRTDLPPREAHQGDVVNAHILSVNDSSVELECLGVETRINAYNLLDNEIIVNCEDHVSVGDTIPVKIKKIYLKNDGSVYLSVTGRLSEVSRLISTLKIGGNYQGQMEKYNKEKGVYTILLRNGVFAAVPEKSVMGELQLNRGDVVQVHVANKHETFVTGSAMLIKRNSRL